MGLVLALSACGGPPQNAATGDSTIIASTYATTDPNFPTTSPPSTGSPTASPTSAGAPAENRNGTAICESIDASALTAALGETYKFTEFGAADANYVGCFANVTSGSLPTDPHVTAVTFSTLKLLGSTDLAVKKSGTPHHGARSGWTIYQEIDQSAKYIYLGFTDPTWGTGAVGGVAYDRPQDADKAAEAALDFADGLALLVQSGKLGFK